MARGGRPYNVDVPISLSRMRPSDDPPSSTTPAHELVERLDSLSTAAEPSQRRSGAELNVGILLWPRFPLLSLGGLCDALRHAADRGDQSRQLRCVWTTIGAPNSTVESSCGIAVPVQSVFPDVKQFDYIVAIGGLLPHLDQVDKRCWDYLREAAQAGVPLVGICTGSFVLARAGLMDDRVACVHSFHFDDYRNMFPGLRVVTHADYLIDGDRVTCAGGISVIELAARLINLHCGPDRAAKVIHQMTVSRQAGSSFVERRRALGYLSVDDATVRHAALLMEENLEAPLNIAVIAKMVGTSVRQLERAFMAEMKVSPNEFYRRMRLRYARWMLLNTSRKVTDIAYDCGFADSAHFIRVFREAYGVTPGKLRSSRSGPTTD
ncbi:GlxA family transcriptional regulator [Burkholderia multivorans]|nr:GlxA family transcriptional regulator [Burkholderia multivorans]AVR21438.1 GlxA family transcriptional regulator [Burkholderia multivorans]EED98963.1 transcriptional regulator, AraC family [Burkholderia multivorans CGD1]EJO52953.1 DNA-binding helix-turn-helix protein [Burkholderia multivorans ATCC BAA-247]MBJ9655223.1 GlxA family transcriptional regulator [Burkholderia multivorans]MBR7922047.1 GlxA family transcriptional regulator [Burkholderia multivorans]